MAVCGQRLLRLAEENHEDLSQKVCCVYIAFVLRVGRCDCLKMDSAKHLVRVFSKKIL